MNDIISREETEKVVKREFETYIKTGSKFDQISWKLRPDHIEANGLLTREQLVELCFNFYLYGITDSSKIKEQLVDECLYNKTSKDESSI